MAAAILAADTARRLIRLLSRARCRAADMAAEDIVAVRRVEDPVLLLIRPLLLAACRVAADSMVVHQAAGIVAVDFPVEGITEDHRVVDRAAVRPEATVHRDAVAVKLFLHFTLLFSPAYHHRREASPQRPPVPPGNGAERATRTVRCPRRVHLIK